jgi:hypothetical protein
MRRVSRPDVATRNDHRREHETAGELAHQAEQAVEDIKLVSEQRFAERRAKETAIAELAEARKALAKALPYVSGWSQANEEGWIEKKAAVEKAVRKVLAEAGDEA